MHLESLKIYCDVVERRSFSQAANDNGISQSNASQVVHHLEKRLGLLLLDRSKRPFVVTPEGQRYFEGCRQIVKSYHELEQEIRSLHDESARRLLVASIYSVGLAHMSVFMRRFSSKYPTAQVRLDYMHPDRVYEVVEQGDVDLGLISYPEQSRTLEAIPWRNERLVVVCPPNHRFATEEFIALEQLSGEPLIAFAVGLRIRAEIDRILVQYNVAIKVALEFDNIENMKRAVEVNEGVGLLPEPTVAQEVASGSLIKRQLRDVELSRPLGIIHRRDRTLSTLAQQFVSLLIADADFVENSKASAIASQQHWEDMVSQPN